MTAAAAGGVDLHCHVLPGVDDGAPDVTTSLAMLRRAREAGTADVVATPHQHPARYPNSAARLQAAHDRLLEAVAAADEALPRVHLGAEVHLDARLPERVASGDLLALAGGGAVLLELPDVFPLAAVEETLFRLRLDGRRVVLAHPERNAQLRRDPRQLRRLVEMGALAQVTGNSLDGTFGVEVQAVTLELLGLGLAHVVASDAHGLGARSPDLRRARAVATAALGEACARRLFEDHPRALLEGLAIDLVVPAPEPEPRRRRGWLARLLRRPRQGE